MSLVKLLFQGHGSFRLTTATGKVIYIDPYAGTGYDIPADMILVTHQHHDHNCIDMPAKAEGCFVLQNTNALSHGMYSKFDVPALMVKVEAVQAYNANHNRDECVGYLLTFLNQNRNKRLVLYFSGDTSTTDQMTKGELAARKIDYAFLPIDGIYNMDIPEAARCATLIRARHTVPVHMLPGELFSMDRAKQFAKLLGEAAMIIKAGEEIELD